MRQPSTPTSTWTVPVAVVLFATLVLQTAPEQSGPFVDLGRLLSRAALVGAIALLSWRLWTVEGRPGWTAVVVGLATLAGLVVLAVALGFAGYGNMLRSVVGTVVAVLVGIGGAAVVVSDRDSDGDADVSTDESATAD